MGNSLACFSEKNQATKFRKSNKSSRSFNGNVPPPCISRSTSRKSDRIYPNSLRFDQGKCDDDFIREQARVAAALLLQHHQQNGTLTQFERSVSLRETLTSSRKQKRIPRSSSCRARSLSDSIPQHLELLDQVCLSIVCSKLLVIYTFQGSTLTNILITGLISCMVNIYMDDRFIF